MKSKISFVLVAIMALSLFAGCGSTAPAPASTASPDGAASTAEPAVSATDASSSETITLRMLSTTLIEKPDGDVEQELLDAYQAENPNITFEMITVSANDLMPKITAMVTSNDAPDMFSNFTQYLVPLVDMNAIEPLNDILGQAYVDDIAEAVRGEVMFEDKLYIAPWGAIPTGFVYRKDLFDEAGLQPPTTFDEVTEVMKQMTVDTNGDGVTDRYGLALIASNNASAATRFIPMMRNCGAMELKKGGDNFITEINSPGGIATLNYFYQWANVDKVTPPGAGEVDHKAAINLLATEQAVATFSGPHTIGSVVAQNPALAGKFAGAPMPTLKAGDKSLATGTINGVSITSASKNKEAAAAYIKYLTSPENFEKYNAQTNRVPPLKSQITDTIKANTTTSGFIAALDNAYELVMSPYSGDVQSVLAKHLNAMASGAETDAAAAAKAAEEEINHIIGK